MNLMPQKHGIPLMGYALFLIFTILLSNSMFFWVDWHILFGLAYEDGFFEYLTAILFLGASIFMLLAAIKNRNWWFIGLFLLLFVGAGEEISWGQRLLGIDTPDNLKKMNVQGEITLHNLEIFNRENFDKSVKSGWEKILTINTLYRFFILCFGVILPLVVMIPSRIKEWIKIAGIPVPRFLIGIFFLIAWIAFRVLDAYFLTAKEFFAAEEIFESLTAWVWLAIGIDFWETGAEKTPK
jgi:hypothetical protein